MGGPVATHMKCCPAHRNSYPAPTRTMKNPIPQYRGKKKVVREFDRGTRKRFLRKVVPRHWGGGVLSFTTDLAQLCGPMP